MKYDAEVARAIAHWAPHYGVGIAPSLVHAIIEKESTHGRSLVTDEPGGHKSYGPMMVLDTTAAGMGVSNPASLKDPALGIWYGVRYFAKQLQRFTGDTARAIAAYNAGPGNAQRNAAGRFPNQSYVDRVLSFWKQYGGAASGAAAGALLVAVTLYVLARRRRAA